jgi:lipopolysaccharide/colanic/teichoic acid biosynthesis glycosyltransferase
MIAIAQPSRVTGRSERRTVEPTVWGLSICDLHDAYWRSRGVEVVRPLGGMAAAHGSASRGETMRRPDRHADLYLLLAPGRLVLFDLDELVHRLVWRGAAATYVQLISAVGPAYQEHIVTDDNGYVQRIARQYRVPEPRRTRVVLTDRLRIAWQWHRAGDIRDARRGIRRAAGAAFPALMGIGGGGVDRARTIGQCFDATMPVQAERFLAELIERWCDPKRAIDGIEEMLPGVWRRSGDPGMPGAVVVGPLWLGCDQPPAVGECIVGPAWRYDGQAAVAEHAGDGEEPWQRSIPDDGPAPHRVPARIRAIGEIDDRRFTSPPPTPPSRRRGYAFAKRAFDIVVSAGSLALGAPLLLLIAVAIVIDDGFPIFFRHTRQSRGGRLFGCLKFRTMLRNAEQRVAELADRNVCDGPQVFIRDDPRVTRVGAVLRRFHLDELPQLWNVLRGDMSIVGPRPSPDRENQFCPAWRELRLSVRPGITGLWQLNRTRSPGRDFQEWIRYDIEYVRQASLWLDLYICYRTARLLIVRGLGEAGRREP